MHTHPITPLTLCCLCAGYPTVCQMRVARTLVAAGADIVLGAHSHTQQPAEVLLVNGYTGDSGEEQAALAHVPECCRLSGVDSPPRKALVLYGMGAHFTQGMMMFPSLPTSDASLLCRQLLQHHVQRDLPRRPAHDAAADCAITSRCGKPASPLGLAPASLALAVQRRGSAPWRHLGAPHVPPPGPRGKRRGGHLEPGQRLRRRQPRARATQAQAGGLHALPCPGRAWPAWRRRRRRGAGAAGATPHGPVMWYCMTSGQVLVVWMVWNPSRSVCGASAGMCPVGRVGSHRGDARPEALVTWPTHRALSGPCATLHPRFPPPQPQPAGRSRGASHSCAPGALLAHT